jgi:hypothetical protein
METSVVVDDGFHNAFTDLLVWRGDLWLVYVASPSHFASPRSRLILLRSTDAKEWHTMANFNGSGEDIRDPKLAVIHDRLTLFALLNRKFDPLPYKTICSDSGDGVNWSPFALVGAEDWLFGKPKTTDEITWYAPAHNLQNGTAALWRSGGGFQWEMVAPICDYEKADETAIEILPDGQMLAVTRLEAGGGLFGSPDAGTLLSSSRPPYDHWNKMARSAVTRLDGPVLFTIEDRCYAVGRYQPRVRGPFSLQGSIFSSKRTSLFSVNESGLTWLTDLPSAGDTSYAGIATWNGRLVISYYTNISDPSREYSWIKGMFRPTCIQITQITTTELLNFTEKIGK